MNEELRKTAGLYKMKNEKWRINNYFKRKNYSLFIINYKFKHAVAFTLAEVLITLGIIGVVAAMTMPVLISKINDMVFSIQRKKVYSELARVVEQARLNDEFVVNNSYENTIANFRTIQNKFKVTKSCNIARNEGCWTDTCQQHASNINGELGKYCFAVAAGEAQNGAQARSAGFVDNSGRQWIHYKRERALFLIIDVNGNKEPNMLNKDRLAVTLCANRTGENCDWNNVIPAFINTSVYVKDTLLNQ